MARVVAILVMAAALAGGSPAEARGPHGGGGGLFGHAHHGHPINSWMGSRRIRFR